MNRAMRNTARSLFISSDEKIAKNTTKKARYNKAIFYRRLLDIYIAISSAILIIYDHRLAIYFSVLFFLYLASRRLDFRLFVITFILLEETLVYYLGGGLHGEATSLLEDYRRSVPIFLAHFYLRSKRSSKYIELLAGLHGAFREIVLPGYYSAAVVLLGPTIFIYGYPLRRSRGYKPITLASRIAILLAEIIIGLMTIAVEIFLGR